MSFDGFDAFAESPVFKNIIKKEAIKLNIAFVCFYGSRNYSLETDKSDYDFFIVYYPVFENFFTHNFTRFSVIEKDYDYFITPFHEYFRHAMNGNIKFIEPLICGTFKSDMNGSARFSEALRLIDNIKKFISINFKKNFDAISGIIKNKKINIEKEQYTSNTLKYKDLYGYDIKEAINSLRLSYLLENYIKTGEFSFIVKRNPVYKEFENYMNEINAGNISKKQYLDIIIKKMKDLENLKQILIDKDESVKSQLTADKKEIEKDIMNICRAEACFEIEKTF
ncbi:MAG: hypothetical protein ACP5NA_06205 [Candidatus Acidulodesulfobacterium sp.]